MLVLDYLEKTAKRFPDRQAVTDESGSCTFSDLRKCALNIAACIKENYGFSRSPVLVYLPKSKESMQAFMGIVYSGNIYTPVDVNFPFSKVQGVINVLKPSAYISDGKNAAKLAENGVDPSLIIVLEDVPSRDFDVSNAFKTAIDTDPVYVFFTSGSTGVPKGVTISHRSIMDYIDWAAKKFEVDEFHIIANQAPFYFDNSVLDVYLCLKTGAHMHIVPEKLFAFPARLLEFLDENKANFIFWVPSVICNIANKDVLAKIKLPHLKKVVFAGEVMPNKQLNYWRRHLPGCLYANLYGPTEITVDCLYHIVDREFADSEPLPVGAPCENSDVFLLDENDGLVAKANEQGEICVRGSSLSLGYWNSPEKTAEVFTQNPLNPHYPEKIYRTGDLAHYNGRGEIMFDGRKDFQIKHLGYRIELGEIEAAALLRGGVGAACADYDNGRQEIVLFYSGEAGENGLRLFLLKRLPKYMVPARYVKVAELPYSENGKIDRKALRECGLD